MEFTSLFSIFVFLPLCIAVYYLVPRIEQKNIVLIVASLVFYAMGQPYFLPLLLLTAYGNHLLGTVAKKGNQMAMWLGVGINLGLLCLFKLVDGVVSGGENAVSLLPIGISCYTFQMISYHVDICRGKIKPAESFRKLLLYISMFPKMPEGPIVRYEQLQRQLDQRKTNPRAIFEGAIRFVMGLAKKILIADYAANIHQELSTQNYGGAAWLGALLFTFRIYFECVGFADMAIGLGRIFGFRYEENFDLPYTSSSITEFWRRWRITLGSFFRDYVYIPLGGNRKGKIRQIFNLLVVWLLTGLWHGTSWNFIFWGLYFFVLLSVEKQIMPQLRKLPFIVRNLITMFFVLIGWVFFANTSLPELGNTFALLFGKGDFWHASVGVTLKSSMPLILLCVVGCTPLPRYFGYFWGNLLQRGGKKDKFSWAQTVHAISLLLFAAVLLFLCTASLLYADSVPSLYGGSI